MNNHKYLIFIIFISTILSGCDKILEPVSLYKELQPNMQNEQEEFDIDIMPLTFSNANKANQDPYIRTVMKKGSGSQANVMQESELLNIEFPSLLENASYSIGIGDRLGFILQNEYINKEAQWPNSSSPTEYLIGAGDILTFTQHNNVGEPLSVNTDNLKILDINSKGALIKTDGIVGTNGNVLLLGIGNIRVGNRSLSEVRSEVRNILIRDGYAPNFQLEVTGFNSKKAYLTSKVDKNASKIIEINHLPITLDEIALSNGISKSSQDYAIITLSRGKNEFRIPATQLFDPAKPKIYIRNNDIIQLEALSAEPIAAESIVDSKGYVLFPLVGNIRIAGKTIADVQLEVAEILESKGFKSNFQLELIGFNSKAAYLNNNNISIVVPISDKNLSMRELLLTNIKNLPLDNGINIFTLKRNNKEYRTNIEKILDPKSKDILVQDADQIEIKTLDYKPGQVFAISGSGNANIISIDPSKRETLADVLFVSGGALKNSLAKRSEIYLLRGKNPSRAFHLNAQNVSRLLVAARTELRPNDIIFVAERPIISFARVLSEITPLRMLLRDIKNDDIP